MSQNSRKMGTSMPGCPASPWKTRLSRLNCHSSWSWCISCSPSHPRLQLSQGKGMQLACHRSHLSQRPHLARQQAFHCLCGCSLRYQRRHQGLCSSCPSHMPGNNWHSTKAVCLQGQQAMQPNVSSIPRAPPSQPWASPANTRFPALPVTEGLIPAQVPAPLRGKIQRGEYVDLSELLVHDFQYWYSGLDDSQVLEVVDGKLSLAPKRKARHLLNLQLWL